MRPAADEIALCQAISCCMFANNLSEQGKNAAHDARGCLQIALASRLRCQELQELANHTSIIESSDQAHATTFALASSLLCWMSVLAVLLSGSVRQLPLCLGKCSALLQLLLPAADAPAVLLSTTV